MAIINNTAFASGLMEELAQDLQWKLLLRECHETGFSSSSKSLGLRKASGKEERKRFLTQNQFGKKGEDFYGHWVEGLE